MYDFRDEKWVELYSKKIDEMIERKQHVAARVVAAKEDWLTELSNEQLKDLFQLRQEAIGE